jgi:O-antigen/teichoic acid export membrane protein
MRVVRFVKRSKRAVINVIVSIVNKIVVMLMPFIVRSVAIYTIGIQYLGVDSLFGSILTMLNLSDLGFSSAVVFSMYKPIAENDDIKVKAILTFYKKIYRIIGIFILIVGLILVPFLDWLIPNGEKYPSDINIQLVYIILLINTSLSYLMFAYKSSILVATMRNDIESTIDMIRSVALNVIRVVILLLFKNYYFYIIILPIITIVTNVIRCRIVDNRFPQYIGNEVLKKCDKYEIITRVGALIGNRIGSVVFSSVDTIVISRFLGLTILAQYTNYYTIFAAVYGIESTVFTAIQSVIGNVMAEDSVDNYRIFEKLFIINSIISIFCTCCFVILYQPFIRIWVGTDNLLHDSIPLLLAAYFYIRSIGKTCFVFYEAAGLWKADFLKPYLSVLFNIVSNLMLVRIIGLPGVIISSILAIIVVELPWETRVIFKNIFPKKIMKYIVELIKSLVICSVLGLVLYFIGMYLPLGVIGIVIRIGVVMVLCTLVFGVLIRYVMSYEFITSIIKRFIQWRG